MTGCSCSVIRDIKVKKDLITLQLRTFSVTSPTCHFATWLGLYKLRRLLCHRTRTPHQ